MDLLLKNTWPQLSIREFACPIIERVSSNLKLPKIRNLYIHTNFQCIILWNNLRILSNYIQLILETMTTKKKRLPESFYEMNTALN